MRHALARGLTYNEHLRTISAVEMAEWEALDAIDPLFDRADIHTAQICTVIAGILAKKAPKLETYILGRLLFPDRERAKPQTADEMKVVAMKLHELFKGRK